MKTDIWDCLWISTSVLCKTCAYNNNLSLSTLSFFFTNRKTYTFTNIYTIFATYKEIFLILCKICSPFSWVSMSGQIIQCPRIWAITRKLHRWGNQPQWSGTGNVWATQKVGSTLEHQESDSQLEQETAAIDCEWVQNLFLLWQKLRMKAVNGLLDKGVARILSKAKQLSPSSLLLN